MTDNIKAIAETIYQELKKHKVAMTEYYAEQVATALDSAGYRKQSDTVKEFAEKIVEKYGKSCSEYYPLFIEMTSLELSKLAEQFGKEGKDGQR